VTTATWVLFDFAGVVGHHQSDEVRRRLPRAAGAEVGAFWRAYWEHRDDYDSALLAADEYWERVTVDCAGTRTDVAALTRLDVESWLDPDAATLSLVDDLVAAGCGVALLSNAPVELAEAIERTPWMVRFEPKVFSCRLGVSKPDPRSYRGALDAMGATPDAVVFVDDRAVNVDAALEVGMRAHRFTDAESLRHVLVRALS
jgi:putative hydrolase of the HAD superfamily